jgi:hypothetical protein
VPNLRALIFLLLLPMHVFAAAGGLEASVSTFSASGSATPDPTSTAPTVGNISSTLTMHSPSLWENSTVLSAAVTESKNDYSAILLTNASGAQSPLSQTFNLPEQSVEADAEYKQGSQTPKFPTVKWSLKTVPIGFK